MESTHKSALLTWRQWRKDGESFKKFKEKKTMHFHHDINCDKKFHVFYGVIKVIQNWQKKCIKYIFRKKICNEGKNQMNTKYSEAFNYVTKS